MRAMLVSALTFVACNSSSTPPPPQNLPLVQCTSGWWMDGMTTPCDTYCLPNAPMPECKQSDCVARAVSGYMTNGQLVGAVITYSAASSSLSSTGPPTVQTYQVVDDTGIKLVPPDKVMAASCKSTGLSVSYANYVRPPGGVSSALDKAAAGGTSMRWTGVVVPK